MPSLVRARHSPWQQPDHPDPKAINLKLLARVLEIFVAKGNATYGCFYDFGSIFQKGPNGEERTPIEATLFSRALTNMMDWYAHLKLLTFKLTKLPEGYPDGFVFPPGVTPNVAGYFNRGWCALRRGRPPRTWRDRARERGGRGRGGSPRQANAAHGATS